MTPRRARGRPRARARRVAGRRRGLRLGLDLGGVLITPLMPGLARRVAEATGRPQEEIAALLRSDFRRELFSGRLPEQAVWDRVGLPANGIDRAALLGLEVLPAARRVREWAGLADIWIVSNHRLEWVAPLIREAGIDEVAARVLVSSATGRVKPDHAALEPLVADGTDPESVLFVDDQPRNLEAAEDLGIGTLLADDDGDWTLAVDAWLAGEGEEPEED